MVSFVMVFWFVVFVCLLLFYYCCIWLFLVTSRFVCLLYCCCLFMEKSKFNITLEEYITFNYTYIYIHTYHGALNAR